MSGRQENVSVIKIIEEKVMGENDRCFSSDDNSLKNLIQGP